MLKIKAALNSENSLQRTDVLIKCFHLEICCVSILSVLNLCLSAMIYMATCAFVARFILKAFTVFVDIMSGIFPYHI
jgi:hypothetical protein